MVSKTGEIENFINNTVNKSTGLSPSQLIFGINQRDSCVDQIQEFVNENVNTYVRDIDHLRSTAFHQLEKTQLSQKRYYDNKHKKSRSYQIRDLIMIRNFDSTLEVSKKLIPRFRDPCEVQKILRNDRYLIVDCSGFQNSQKTYTDIWSSSNLRLWLKINQFDDNYDL